MSRYIIVIWNPTESHHAPQSIRDAIRTSEWSIDYEAPGALAIHAGGRRRGAETYPLQLNCGVVLGTIFDGRRSDYSRSCPVRFDEQDTRKIVTSNGKHLFDKYWGSYVALIHDSSRCTYHVLRDPTCTVPCYHVCHDGRHIFFSHVEDCVRFFPFAPAPDQRYLTRYLLRSGMPVATRDTGLRNVGNPLVGEILTLRQGTVTRSAQWDPAEIAAAPRFEGVEEAAKGLRQTVQRTIDAWASSYQRVVLSLSGGLDSSIVAGCLAQAQSKPQVTYLHISLDVGTDQEPLRLPSAMAHLADKIKALGGTGDERYFARLVAERWKTPFVEKLRTNHGDLLRLWDVPLRVSPVQYFANMETDEIQIELFKSVGAQAFFTGLAGDSVFQASFDPLSAIDYAFLHGFIDRRFWQHALDACKLGKDSLWSVLAETIKRGMLGRQHVRRSPLDRPSLLTDEFKGALTERDFDHPLTAPGYAPDLPPGKRSYVAGLASMEYYSGVFRGEDHADHIDPLNSQPVWEYLLRVPTYTILHKGISRGLARHAFADLLPPEIRMRQTKGAGAPFLQRQIRDNKDLLLDCLECGLLVREGYLDRQKLIACLSAEEPFVIVDAKHLAACLTSEIWLQQWKDLREKRPRYANARNASPVAL